jgi:hypothetical protein
MLDKSRVCCQPQGLYLYYMNLFFVYQVSPAGPGELCGPSAGYILTCYRDHPVCGLRGKKYPSQGTHTKHARMKESEDWLLHWMEKPRDSGTLPTSFSAFRPCPAINHTVERTRLWKSSDLLNLVSEDSVLLGSKWQVVMKKLWRPSSLTVSDSRVLSFCSNPQTMAVLIATLV